MSILDKIKAWFNKPVNVATVAANVQLWVSNLAPIVSLVLSETKATQAEQDKVNGYVTAISTAAVDLTGAKDVQGAQPVAQAILATVKELVSFAQTIPGLTASTKTELYAAQVALSVTLAVLVG
jgi:hypothetical protein